MPGKGAKHCCCNGCNEKPLDRALGNTDLQPQQQYCCACVPKQICVTVDVVGGTSATKVFDRDCTAVVGDPILYSGEIYSDGQLLDLEFVFTIDNGECYLCLRSTALSVTGVVPDNCNLIDDSARIAGFCRSMLLYGQPASWTVGDYTVSIFRANNTAIENRENCVDESGTVILDDHPIRNICCNCGCITECACITVFGDALVASPEYVCLGGTTAWTRYDGVQVSLVANYETGQCELELTSTGPYEIGAAPDNITVGDVSNECPAPYALWSMFRTNGKALFVKFNAAQCNDCATIEATCCQGYAPEVLTATFTSVDCPCASFALSLVYNQLTNSWSGTDTTAFCDHTVTVELACSGAYWMLTISADPCLFSTTTTTGSCDPVSLTFSATSSGGIGCCGPSDLGGSKSFTVTITE